MSADVGPGGSLVFAVLEAAVFGALALSVAASFLPGSSLGSSVPVWLRLALAVVLVTFAAAPLWVWYDVRRSGDDWIWVHATLLPLFNLFGLAAYLHHRRTRETATEADESP